MKSKTTAHIVDDTRTLTCKRKPFYTRLHFFFSRRNSWIDLTDAYVLNVWKSSDKWAIYIYIEKQNENVERMHLSRITLYKSTHVKSFQETFFLDSNKKKGRKGGGDWWKYLPMGFRKHGTLLTVCTGVRRNFRRAAAWKLGGSKFIPG